MFKTSICKDLYYNVFSVSHVFTADIMVAVRPVSLDKQQSV